MNVIRDELGAVKDEFADERRTTIIEDHQDLSVEDLIEPQDVVVTLSHAGYVKAQPTDVYQSQRRGGRGKRAATMRDEDFIERVLVAHSHDTILCFSTHGKVYWLRVFDLPLSARTARGRPIVNLLPLGEDERITAILPVQEYSDNHFVLMATSLGTVKKTALTEYSRPRSTGIIAVDLVPEDQLVGVALTDGNCDIMLCSSSGKVIRFPESEARPMGRTARGVRGIRLSGDQRVIALIIPEPDAAILSATANGFGKRTPIPDFPVQGRGGQGVIGIQTSARNGMVVGASAVHENDEIMLISNSGTLIRTPVTDISTMGRNTQGVSLIRVGEGERLVGLERIADDEEPVPHREA
jgi:DNA gyrase subunit A